MSKSLVEELRAKALGGWQFWAPPVDGKLEWRAADRIDELERKLAVAEARFENIRGMLPS